METRTAYRILAGKSFGKLQLVRLRKRMINNNEINVMETVYYGRWLELAQNRVQRWAAVDPVIAEIYKSSVT
jgi:hypothetical protein